MSGMAGGHKCRRGKPAPTELVRKQGIRRSAVYATAFAGTLFAVALAMLMLAGKAAAQGGEWEVVHAEYGIRARHVDVTDIVRRLLWQGRDSGRVPVNNQTMGGDPAVGADKTLHIIAQNARHDQKDFEYPEGSWIDVMMFALRPDRGDDDRRRGNDFRGDEDRRRDDDWDHDRRRDGDDRGRPERLRIIRGYWGAQGQMVNITDMLRGMVRDGVMQVHVGVGSLGGDPAVGRDKVLIVVYVVDGREQAASTREGNTMRIP